MKAMIEDHERELVAALKADGLRMTHQRLEVIHELASSTSHPDVYEVFQAVRRRVPTISIDTVYRTISALVSRGLVQKIAAPGGARFDPDTGAHHHFVCARCGGIVDVDATLVGALVLPVEIEGVGLVRSARLELHGVCAECAGRR